MTCFSWLYRKIRAQFQESCGRTEYKVNRWRAARVRHKWLKQENKYRKEFEYIFHSSSGVHDANEGEKMNYQQTRIAPPLYTHKSQKNKLTWISQMNYKNLNLDENNSDREIPLQNFGKQDTDDKGVSVLSPQRLSERLSENALAREAVGESDLELAQYLKDERIALFLQNDEFISELRSNKEFMSALQRDHDGDADDEEEYDYEESSHSFRGAKRLNSKRSDSGGTMGLAVPPLDDATFRERLTTMGKASKKKFAQLAKVFSRGKRPSGPRALLPGGAGGTSDTNGKDLLMSSDALIDDYDDEKSTPINEEVQTMTPRKNP